MFNQTVQLFSDLKKQYWTAKLSDLGKKYTIHLLATGKILTLISTLYHSAKNNNKIFLLLVSEIMSFLQSFFYLGFFFHEHSRFTVQ